MSGYNLPLKGNYLFLNSLVIMYLEKEHSDLNCLFITCLLREPLILFVFGGQIFFCSIFGGLKGQRSKVMPRGAFSREKRAFFLNFVLLLMMN